MRGIFSTQASCCTPPFMDTCGSVMGGLSDLPGEAGLARWGEGGGWRRNKLQGCSRTVEEEELPSLES